MRENDLQESIVDTQEKIEMDESEFDHFKGIFVGRYGFSESEFLDLCAYCLEGDIAEFLINLEVIMENYGEQKEEIMKAIKEIDFSNGEVFCNYLLIKRKSRVYQYKDVKRVVDKGYAWTYITDSLKGIELVGTFDNAMAALKLALQNGVFSKKELVYTTKVLGPAISDLGQALINAGIAEKRG